MIAVGGDRTGVLVVPYGGGAPRQLTEDPYHNRPVWGPSGVDIVFTDDSSEGSSAIHLVDAHGSTAPRALLDEPGAFLADEPWSPDARRILFYRTSGELATVDVDSKRIEREGPAPPCRSGEEIRELRWNDDGSMTAFCSQRLVVRESGSSSWTTIDDHGGRHAVMGPEKVLWWIDGARAFALHRWSRGQSSIVSLEKAIGSFDVSSRTGMVVADEHGADLAILSASGSVIGRVSGDCTPDQRYSPSPQEGYLMPRFDAFPQDGAPAWSKDGRRLAFVRLVAPSSAATLCVAEIEPAAAASK